MTYAKLQITHFEATCIPLESTFTFSFLVKMSTPRVGSWTLSILRCSPILILKYLTIWRSSVLYGDCYIAWFGVSEYYKTLTQTDILLHQ